MSQKGITLFELLLVLGIVSILMAGITLSGGLIDQYRLKSIHSSIQSAMLLARSQAMLTHMPVRIEPLIGLDWSSGIHMVNHQDQELLVLNWFNQRVHVAWFGTQPYILFHPNIHHAMCNGHVHIQIGNMIDESLILNRICKLRSV